jgi:hypothetical protein
MEWERGSQFPVFGPVALAVMALACGACKDSAASRARDDVQAVRANRAVRRHVSFAIFPRETGKRACSVHVSGGAAALGSVSGEHVPGTCSTSVREDKSEHVVVFQVHWRKFYGPGWGFACRGQGVAEECLEGGLSARTPKAEVGRYTWEFRLDSKRRIVETRTHGDLAPWWLVMHLAVVSPAGRVGKLQIELQVDKSTSADVRRFAGTPEFAGTGTTSANFADILPSYEALGYWCSRQRTQGLGLDPGGARPKHMWCRTVYFVNPKTGKFAGLWTDSTTFRTAKGSRPGMRQEEADRLEGAHPYIHALTGIDRGTRTANLFIENAGCKPGTNLNASPCLGGHVTDLILESARHPVGLLEDAIPFG